MILQISRYSPTKYIIVDEEKLKTQVPTRPPFRFYHHASRLNISLFATQLIHRCRKKWLMEKDNHLFLWSH